MLKSRAKGDRSERLLMRGLELQGYAVTRAGGSLGAWDLIATNTEHVLFIQVVVNRWKSPLEMVELEKVPMPKVQEVVLKVVARMNDEDPEVRARVTVYGEAWYESPHIQGVLTMAAVSARLEISDNAARRRRAR